VDWISAGRLLLEEGEVVVEGKTADEGDDFSESREFVSSRVFEEGAVEETESVAFLSFSSFGRLKPCVEVTFLSGSCFAFVEEDC